ncbi:conserved hypothetical protein [Gloeothece citriformis PCC 7424]|uniref:AB hydrolase-1 domain-containing protein n=1 Tax=Gloeothece citriformis (strain PCC 7424) TaxID=65393 RepID=B7K8T6_GLOC7|nr:alpha/beta hydrolase [Gloeothece citriformis]ACK71284.1 conserved hypothetical protein [Gloeothece citriformis PCC 7424]
MTKHPDLLWLNLSPSLECFNRPLLNYLSQTLKIGIWEYIQTPDEPTSLDVPLVLLHDYLKNQDRPVDLIGHSLSGFLGLLYAQRYPERVKSLTLLAVAPRSALDWQAHYYALFETIPCSRQTILTQMVYNLFGYQCKKKIPSFIEILEQDLLSSPSTYSLFCQSNLTFQSVSVPLFVCGSRDDMVVDPYQFKGWQTFLNRGDRLWQCPKGRHFFHYYYPQDVGEQILQFLGSNVKLSLINA